MNRAPINDNGIATIGISTERLKKGSLKVFLQKNTAEKINYFTGKGTGVLPVLVINLEKRKEQRTWIFFLK